MSTPFTSPTEAIAARRAAAAAEAAEAERRAAEQAAAAAAAERECASAVYFDALAAADRGAEVDVDALDEALQVLALPPATLDQDLATLRALRLLTEKAEREHRADVAHAEAKDHILELRARAQRLLDQAEIDERAAADARRAAYQELDEAQQHVRQHALGLHARGCTAPEVLAHVQSTEQAAERAARAAEDGARWDAAHEAMKRFAGRHRATVVHAGKHGPYHEPFVTREGRRIAEFADFLDGGTGPVLTAYATFAAIEPIETAN